MSRTLPWIVAFGQKPQDNARRIAYVSLPDDGYVMIYGAEADGKPGKQPLGISP
jgi:hypothetical protein